MKNEKNKSISKSKPVKHKKKIEEIKKYSINEYNKALNMELNPGNLESALSERKNELESFLHLRKKPQKQSQKIRISNSHGCPQFYIKKAGDKTCGSYLTYDKVNIAQSIIQDEYDYKVWNAANKELQQINRMMSVYDSGKILDIRNRLSKERKNLIRPALLNDEEFIRRWNSVDYEHKPFSEGSAEHYTASGIRVRSKSEVLLGDTLDRAGIPYHYEYPLLIKGIGIVHVDFYCLNVRLRKEFAWEHFGIMDNPEYANSAVSKLQKYALDNLTFGVNFIATFETSKLPLNTKIVEKQISKYLI